MEGYIPFEYKNNNYSVNVSIHIPPSYPDKPPTVRIIPAPEKNIILSPNHPKINKDGYYIIDLSHWDSKSNIVSFVEMLRCEFGDKPPIRYNNKNVQNQSNYQYNIYQQNSMYNQNVSYNQNKSPYQSSDGSYYHSNPQYKVSSPIYNNSNPQYHSNNSQYNSHSNPQYSSNNNPQYYINNPQYNSNNPQYNSNSSQYNINNPQYNSNNHKPTYNNFQDQPINPLLESKAKLAKMVEDYVKVILNEKNDTYVKLQKEHHQLQSENKSLLSKINDNYNMIERTESEIKLLSSKIHDLDLWLSEHDKEKGDFDIDEITKLKDPVRDQLLSVMAEDITYDEILYYLDEALKKSVIDITEYLKTYKEIASKQFLCKALAQKIKTQLQQT